MTRIQFRLEATADGARARAARFRTRHNEVLTPTFMPVGTHASVRSQRREDLLASGTQVLLANTYHLLLRPGVEIFEKFGGIHAFMNWPNSVLTDSGGFQIFSLPESRSMREEGASFKSYVDNSTICLSPERSIATQKSIGADIMMVLDQCVPSTVDKDIARAAMELTHRWARRSLEARGDSPQALFGIVQGACYADLRIESARTVTAMPFDGFAIGGLAVGESIGQREDCTAMVTEHLPQDSPRYLMGVGTPLDLLEAVHRGIDMFDCILPTALSRQGVAFTAMGRRDLRRAQYRDMEGPLDPVCGCYTCKTYSLAYLYHLNRVHESQSWQLLGLHNVHFYMQLMRAMRQHILAGTWLNFYRAQRGLLDARDSYGPVSVRHSKTERQRRRLQLGRYEVVVRDGIGRIRDNESGEVMHSVNDPAEEARSLYVEQSHLVDRLKDFRSEAGRDGPTTDRHDGHEKGQQAIHQVAAGPLVVWDVGLGAATNAMAAILAVEAANREAQSVAQHTVAQQTVVRRNLAVQDSAAQEARPCMRKLELVSFDNDLDSLKLAIRHIRWFKHLRHAAPNQLLAHGHWRSTDGSIEWLLLAGDFAVRKYDAPPPDIIFFDPFSSKTDSELWTLQAFRELAEICRDRATEIFTYSYSTAVRAAMLSAGFYVAKGRATGPKAETTIGLSPPAARRRHDRELLGAEWLGKWQRSQAQAPLGVESNDDSWRKTVTAHPQFAC